MRRTAGAARRAFTLIEMLVVIAIIGLIAGLAVPQIMHRMDEARVKTTRMQIREIENAVDMFKMDNGTYPARLGDLVQRPATAKKWPRDGYLKEVPKDAWGNDFEFVCPGAQGAYDIRSFGADGRPGGNDENADVTNYSKGAS